MIPVPPKAHAETHTQTADVVPPPDGNIQHLPRPQHAIPVPQPPKLLELHRIPALRVRVPALHGADVKGAGVAHVHLLHPLTSLSISIFTSFSSFCPIIVVKVVIAIEPPRTQRLRIPRRV
ncbi:hypothetical protein CNYM01_11975 [Colletotrichum nymphaeae SA-01]|uniref:Uncharacterized protein n=1 Tax=Colletotrichum nymphaeae SA-01 TaxID=1460502 RepID=A0A135S9L0_9PEZI|nr:hypothetical protein CNYM01_11975 [Colletotrichum nymphaeae SA-01]